MNRAGVYEIVNTANGKRYIGSAANIDARWRDHRHRLRKQIHHSPALQRAWQKYGENCFEFRVRMLCAPSELIAREQAAFDTDQPEYNSNPVAGNCLGRKVSDAAKAKMRAFRLGRKLSADTRAKMSASHGGRKHSAEAIAKSAASRRGQKRGPLTAERKEKIGAALRGRALRPEHAAAISKGKTGRPRPDMAGNRYGAFTKSDDLRRQMSEAQKGRPKSEETRARMRAAWVRRKARKSAEARP